MRVLFVAHGFPPSSMGGTEIYASTLARALGERRHEVLVLAREARPDLPEYHVRRDTHERVCAPLVTCVTGTSCSGTAGASFWKRRRETSPWSRLTPLA